MQTPYYLKANWPAKKHIRALTVTYPESFSEIKHDLKLPTEPIWLKQIHTNICVRVEDDTTREADATITSSKMHPLVIKTADCLPILLCDKAGTEIAAIHGGWRGLLGGIIENTLSRFNTNPEQLMAWTGPAICKNCFEVGEEVPEAFIKQYPYTKSAFHPAKQPHKYFGNLVQIATLILKNHGVTDIHHSNACTFEEEKKFYSYRRAKQTGRMATLIWFDNKMDD
ncbi:MAG: peptidoglycan editing factor PgeF [Gammaproteobacteria bacterium]|nr:peptidoglycan editing factor PgeF [Gammaproteobacteria bacterium]